MFGWIIPKQIPSAPKQILKLIISRPSGRFLRKKLKIALFEENYAFWNLGRSYFCGKQTNWKNFRRQNYKFVFVFQKKFLSRFIKNWALGQVSQGGIYHIFPPWQSYVQLIDLIFSMLLFFVMNYLTTNYAKFYKNWKKNIDIL